MKEIMIAKTLAAIINKSAKWYCGCRSPICNKEFVLSMNRGSNLILTNFVGVHPRNVYRKFEANQCFGQKVKNGILHSDTL